MSRWRVVAWIIGAVAGLLALFGLRRSSAPPAAPNDEAARLRAQAKAREAELRQQHADEQLRLERERTNRDEEIRLEAEMEMQRNAVDRANDELDRQGWRPPGRGGGVAGGGG